MGTPFQKSRILIADDDAGVRRLLKFRLDMEGYENIVFARNGYEALDVIQEGLPDIILLDVMMPNLDGFEVLKDLRKKHQGEFIPVILISALQDTASRVKGLSLGANDFISKPFQPEEVSARIQSLLTMKYTRDDLAAERRKMEILYNINRAITEKLDVQHLLKLITERTLELTHADKATFILVDPDGEFSAKVINRKEEEPKIREVFQEKVLQEGLVGWVLKQREHVIIPDVSKDDRWVELDEDDGTCSVIAVPLTRGETIHGVLILNSNDCDHFQPEDSGLLVSLGAQAAVALENAALYESAEEEKARFEAFIQETGDPVIMVDKDGRITQINPSAKERLDLGGEVIGTTLGDFSLSLEDLFFRSQERESSVSGDLTLRYQDGTRVSYNVRVSPIKDAGYVLTWRDITALREGERVRLDSEIAEKERFLDALKHYMSPSLFKQVLNDPNFFERLERREAVVMFADLRGFTYLSTQFSPSVVMDVLNTFFTEMQVIVYQYEGIIFEIKGDEIMIAFNVPYDQENASRRSLDAAIAMQRRFIELEKQWQEDQIAMGLGIGISSGDIVIGHAGSKERKNYAMVGETVNIAHRLVDLAEKHQIVFSENIAREGIPEGGGITHKKLADQKVKGKDEKLPLRLIEVSH